MNDKRSKIFLVASSGFFLSFVLYVYEAFGIQQGLSFSGHSLLFRSIVFGLGVSFIFMVNEYMLLPRLRLSSLAKRVTWWVWEIWTASLITFFFFNYFWNYTELYWDGYFLMLGEITAVLLVPFGISFLIAERNRDPKRVEFISLHSDSGKERVNIKLDSLLYIKADDNYINLVMMENGKKKSRLLRQRLSQVETDLRRIPSLKRIHRSYIINTRNILKLESKNKRAKVYFDLDEVVPVGEKYHHVLNSLEIHPE